MNTALCGKCKKVNEFKTEPTYEEKSMSKGKRAFLKGHCKDCGSKMVKITKVRV